VICDFGKLLVALLSPHQNRLWLWVPAFAGTTSHLRHEHVAAFARDIGEDAYDSLDTVFASEAKQSRAKKEAWIASSLRSSQ
jgi:hypothetical protein